MSAPAPSIVVGVEPPRNCWTCRWSRYIGDALRARGLVPNAGGYTCDALTLDEARDRPILDYVDAHCGEDGMPIDSAPCPGWAAR